MPTKTQANENQYRTDSNFVRLFKLAVARAERKVGQSVFDFQPLVIRKALVASEILTIVNEQDDDVTDAKVRTLALVLDSMLAHWGAK